jgi:hypothetical protein
LFCRIAASVSFEHYYLDTVARGGGQIGGDSEAGFSDDVTQPIQRIPKAHRQGFLVVGFFVPLWESWKANGGI